jgi:hypothetical protein
MDGWATPTARPRAISGSTARQWWLPDNASRHAGWRRPGHGTYLLGVKELLVSFPISCINGPVCQWISDIARRGLEGASTAVVRADNLIQRVTCIDADLPSAPVLKESSRRESLCRAKSHAG